MPAVGTFLPATGTGGGVIAPDEHSKLLRLLEETPGWDVVHGLDFRDTHIRRGRVYREDVCLSDLDVYLWHVDFARKPGSYDLDALLTLTRDTVVIPDPEQIALAFDKHWAYLTLDRAGVAVPDSILVSARNIDAAEHVLAEWGCAVLKPRRGCFGWGVTFIDSFTTLRDIVGYIDSETTETRVRGVSQAGSGRSFLLERFYPNSPHDWLGVTFVGDEVAYGFRKDADRHARWNDTAWKVYDAGRGGGSVQYHDVPPSHLTLLHTARRAFDLPLIGFDVICHEGRPMIVDVNTGPALYQELFAAAGKTMSRELHRAYTTAVRLRG
ncbi:MULTISPECIES: ATP-grasp domain-containing protein [unclassified Saccharothrix]|uniref:ATP-grasp domain-containing protein n=1 Tax=unclassified Saccharothrix TaxID=2593673 RepID=UPI00307F5D2C